MLYIDLAEMVLAVEGIVKGREVEKPERWVWQNVHLRTHVASQGEKYPGIDTMFVGHFLLRK